MYRIDLKKESVIPPSGRHFVHLEDSVAPG
jgi:hypothetical protein